jgi:hypothetical protein
MQERTSLDNRIFASQLLLNGHNNLTSLPFKPLSKDNKCLKSPIVEGAKLPKTSPIISATKSVKDQDIQSKTPQISNIQATPPPPLKNGHLSSSLTPLLRPKNGVHIHSDNNFFRPRLAAEPRPRFNYEGHKQRNNFCNRPVIYHSSPSSVKFFNPETSARVAPTINNQRPNLFPSQANLRHEPHQNGQHHEVCFFYCINKKIDLKKFKLDFLSNGHEQIILDNIYNKI